MKRQRDKIIQFRVNNVETVILDNSAKKKDLTLSKYIRYMLFGIKEENRLRNIKRKRRTRTNYTY